MVEEIIGINAGKIWASLESSGSLTKHQIQRKTQLTDDEFDQAIGWLARENKVKKVGEFFSLDQTNLTELIGEKAGFLFQTLQRMPHDITAIHDITDFTKEELNQSIGWLSREGNIPVSSETDPDEIKEAQLTVQLLQDEIHSLHEDIQSRNHIIHDLTSQLTTKQMMFMSRADVVEKMNMEIMKSHELTMKSEEELSDKQQRIENLTEEIHLLHDEIITRNQIIHDLTNQLTDKQTQFIERSEALDRLQAAICQKKPSSMTSVTDIIHERVESVSSLQEAWQKKQDHTLINQTDKSTLFDTHAPIITINEEQHKDLCDELNNVLSHTKHPFGVSMTDENTMDAEAHKKSIERSGDHLSLIHI